MKLPPSDVEKLLLSVAGMVARDRRARGVRLNHPEAVALLATWVIERARDGDATVEQLMADGRHVLAPEELMDGVAELLDEVQVEATFPDGRKLVTLHQPVASTATSGSLPPGAVVVGSEPVPLAPGRERRTLDVINDGDRPVQVGSHFHFADANGALRFDRDAARGFRLDVPAGTSVRFEPGLACTVTLVALAGARHVAGLQLREVAS
ncbi:urease subunit gamma [Conexibacter woesei]|uniref:urease n=1 Tax=Conexibacter woesei (strain DSM 14684 / CCUG 47730 / CIP 108061 / JCM 11494 / NBRC 100937 / ID131577) TaxID=469383 RepID=D3EZF6_CONWI|nr:urease subunit gamma [Conexibacter woesei]ADB51921.1 urease, gamma subunit [Conexibacter woesei DSM 14684]